MLGACSVITGGTLAGLAATGAGGDPSARGTATAAADDSAGTGRLNATSPARVPASPASPRGTRGGPEARQESASPRATSAAGHLDPFGTAATSYLSGRAGTVLAAVYDLGTGRTWNLGHGGPQAEASVVKLDILETLLAERGQGSSIGLSAGDRSLAEQMIEDSDNDAATSLWYAAGGPAKIGSFNARAGLTHTAPSSCVACPGFAWPGWGLTTTTPDDQISLLKQLVTPGSLLSGADRDYALSLMKDVTPSQRWGVSGGVPAGVTVALKNGWLPLRGSNSDWQVNSVGWIHGGGRVTGTVRSAPYDLGAYEYVAPSGESAIASYATWLLANGLPADGSGLGGKAGNPSGDGVVNEMKFALGLPVTAQRYGGRVTTGTTAVADQSYLTLTFTYPDPAPVGASYTVKSGADLSSWSPTSVVEMSNTVSGGLRTRTYRDTVAIGSGGNRFIVLDADVP